MSSLPSLSYNAELSKEDKIRTAFSLLVLQHLSIDTVSFILKLSPKEQAETLKKVADNKTVSPQQLLGTMLMEVSKLLNENENRIKGEGEEVEIRAAFINKLAILVNTYKKLHESDANTFAIHSVFKEFLKFIKKSNINITSNGLLAKVMTAFFLSKQTNG